MIELIIIAPFVNKKGGTEKVIAYLIENLSLENRIILYTSKIEDIGNDCLSRLKIYFIPVIPYPFLFTHLSFFIIVSLLIFFHKLKGKIKYQLITTHGIDSIYGEIFTAHYCHRERVSLVKKGIIKLPSSNLFQIIKKIYKYTIYYYSSILEYLFFKLVKPKLILAISEGMKNNFLKYGLSKPESIMVVYNPVDMIVFNPKNKSLYRNEIRKKHNVSDDDVILLFVGGDWERKGLPILIDIIPQVLANGILFICGGQEKEINKYTEIIKTKNIENRVFFIGFTEETEKYYVASDIFILYSFYEGFSLATIEAAASGLPLILAPVNGSEEILQDECNGFIVKSRADLIERINLLIKDKSLREKMGECSAEISKKYSKEKIAKLYLEAYQKIINQKYTDK